MQRQYTQQHFSERAEYKLVVGEIAAAARYLVRNKCGRFEEHRTLDQSNNQHKPHYLPQKTRHPPRSMYVHTGHACSASYYINTSVVGSAGGAWPPTPPPKKQYRGQIHAMSQQYVL